MNVINCLLRCRSTWSLKQLHWVFALDRSKAMPKSFLFIFCAKWLIIPLLFRSSNILLLYTITQKDQYLPLIPPTFSFLFWSFLSFLSRRQDAHTLTQSTCWKSPTCLCPSTCLNQIGDLTSSSTSTHFDNCMHSHVHIQLLPMFKSWRNGEAPSIEP